MILAAGLTPAWQQVLVFDSLELGEVNRALQAHWFSSGKVVNVGIAMNSLGAESRTLTLLGGDPGKSIERELSALGVDGRYVWSQSATRVCTTVLESACRRTTELVENAGPVTDEELALFARLYEDQARSAEFVVLTGSTPKGTPTSFYRDLMARTAGRVIVDAREHELREALSQKPFLVKPNREELSRTVGHPLDSDNDLLVAMRQLNDAGAEWVVSTQGKNAVWASSRSGVYRFEPPTVDVVNPIGCGDCMAAGLAWALAAGQPPLDAIRLGISAAAENATQLLPGRLDSAIVTRRATSIGMSTVV